jgi:hypothetical protein
VVSREGAARAIEISLGYGISAVFIREGLLSNGNPAAGQVVIDRAAPSSRRSSFGTADPVTRSESDNRPEVITPLSDHARGATPHIGDPNQHPDA